MIFFSNFFGPTEMEACIKLAAQGKSASQGGLNVAEIKQVIASCGLQPGQSRSELERQLKSLIGAHPAAIDLPRSPAAVGLPRSPAVGLPRSPAVGLPRSPAVGLPRPPIDLPRPAAVGLPRSPIDLPRPAAVGLPRPPIDLPRPAPVDLPRPAAVGLPRPPFAIGVPLTPGLTASFQQLSLKPRTYLESLPAGHKKEALLAFRQIILDNAVDFDQTQLDEILEKLGTNRRFDYDKGHHADLLFEQWDLSFDDDQVYQIKINPDNQGFFVHLENNSTITIDIEFFRSYLQYLDNLEEFYFGSRWPTDTPTFFFKNPPPNLKILGLPWWGKINVQGFEEMTPSWEFLRTVQEIQVDTINWYNPASLVPFQLPNSLTKIKLGVNNHAANFSANQVCLDLMIEKLNQLPNFEGFVFDQIDEAILYEGDFDPTADRRMHRPGEEEPVVSYEIDEIKEYIEQRLMTRGSSFLTKRA